jgi:hypothetical protein
LVAPAAEAEVVCVPSLTLEWEAVNVSGMDVRYTWQVYRSDLPGDAGKEGPYLQPRYSGTTDDTSVELTDDTTCERWYRWSVRAEDASDASNTGPLSEALFYVGQPGTPTPTLSPTPDAEAPEAPELFAPANSSFFRCGESVELIWDEVDDPSGIDRYEWEIDYSNEGRDGRYANEDRDETLDTSVTLSTLDCRDGAWFRWRVRAIDNAGNEGDFSEYRYFEIDAPE